MSNQGTYEVCACSSDAAIVPVLLIITYQAVVAMFTAQIHDQMHAVFKVHCLKPFLALTSSGAYSSP